MKYFTTVICFGCAYEHNGTTLPLLLFDKFSEVHFYFGYLPRSKSQLIAVVEAVDPSNMTPTSIPNTYEVPHNLHRMWVCIWSCCHHITTALVPHVFRRYIYFGVHPKEQFTE